MSRSGIAPGGGEACRWFNSTLGHHFHQHPSPSRCQQVRRGSAFARAQQGHPPDHAVEARSVLFRERLLERLEQQVRVLRPERQRRANLEHIAVAAG